MITGEGGQNYWTLLVSQEIIQCSIDVYLTYSETHVRIELKKYM